MAESKVINPNDLALLIKGGFEQNAFRSLNDAVAANEAPPLVDTNGRQLSGTVFDPSFSQFDDTRSAIASRAGSGADLSALDRLIGDAKAKFGGAVSKSTAAKQGGGLSLPLLAVIGAVAFAVLR